MALTFTGSKYSGNLTSVGTLTLTDSGQTFVAADFDQGVAVQGGQRIAVLWNNAITVFKGVALIDDATSGTVLKLLTEFLDPLTGDPVTQVVGGSADAYTISQNMADLVGGALTQNEFQFTTTDEIIWGVAGDPDGITFYDENITLLFDNALGGGSGMNNEFRGGYIQFGKVLDWAAFTTSQGCHIMGDDGVNNVEMMIVTDDECKLVIAGTTIHNHRHQGSRMGSGGGGSGGNGSEAKFQIYMNCSTNANIASGPTTGQAWDANAADQRLINMDYWGTGNTGTNGSGVGVRWGDGVILGGSYGFARENGSIGMFGSDVTTVHSIGPVAQAGVTNLRLRVLNILQSGDKTVLYRTGTEPVASTVTYINVLTDDRRAGFGVTPGSNANNNVGMDFTFEEIYTGLVQNTRLVVERDVDGVVADSDVAGADGQALIRLLHEEVTGHTSDNKYTAFAMGAWLYGFDPVVDDVDESTTPVLSGTAEDLIFGGAIVQPPDLGITEPTQATVAAYTDINDADRLYDRAADWKMLTDANAQYPGIKTKLIAAEGNLAAVAVGTDLDIDSGAAAVFAVDTGTDLLTVDCAAAFDPGVTFAGIKADNIQFLGAATIGDGLILTGNVTINAAMDLTGVVIDGDLRIDIGADAVLDFTGVIVTGNVFNDSAGNTLTINADPTSAITTTEPGTGNGQVEILSPVPITILGVVANTQLAIFRVDDDTELFNEEVPPTSRFWWERFEADPGYDNVWSEGETVGGGSTVDEDQVTSGITGSADRWELEALRIVTAATEDAYVQNNFSGDEPIVYVSIDTVLNAESFATNEGAIILSAFDNSGNILFTLEWFQSAAGLRIRANIRHDDSDNFLVPLAGTLSLDTRYTVEVKWDVTNSLWEWRITDYSRAADGALVGPVTLDSGSLTSTRQFRRLRIGATVADAASTFYLDRVAVDDADWTYERATLDAVLFNFNYPGSDVPIRVELRKSQFAPKYLEKTILGTITANGLVVDAAQVLDETAAVP